MAFVVLIVNTALRCYQKNKGINNAIFSEEKKKSNNVM